MKNIQSAALKKLQVKDEKKAASHGRRALKFFSCFLCAASIMYGANSYAQSQNAASRAEAKLISDNVIGSSKAKIATEDSVYLSGSALRAFFSGVDTLISFEGQLEEKFGFKSFPENTIIESWVKPGHEKMFFILSPKSKSILIVYKSLKTHKVSSYFLTPEDSSKLGKNPVYAILPKGGIFALTDNFTFLYFDQTRAFYFRPKDIFSRSGAPDSDAKVRACYEEGELVVMIDSKNVTGGPIEFLPNLLLWRYAGND